MPIIPRKNIFAELHGVDRSHFDDATRYWLQDGSIRSPRAMTLPAMIATRLHLGPGDKLPFEFIEAHRSRCGEKVFVFVVAGDKAVTLEDEWPLFPSDTLITSLRLLEKK
jgi:hypothetical protein